MLLKANGNKYEITSFFEKTPEVAIAVPTSVGYGASFGAPQKRGNAMKKVLFVCHGTT
jgi:hypothetical protein